MTPFQPIACLLPLLALLACAPKEAPLGYVKNMEWKDGIAVGQTTKDEVMARFGSPSAQSGFGADAWYYISGRQETVAFFKPEIAEQEVVRIEFGPTGIVSDLQLFDKSSGRDIELVKRETPTEGHSMGVAEQLIGNIGRFNRPSGQQNNQPY